LMHHIYSIPVAYTVLYLFKLALGNNPYTIDNIVNCVGLSPII
jgi:hypothetical protein